MRILRIGCLALVLLIPAFRSVGASLPSQVEGHRSGMMARVVSADGTSRTVRLEGVGCTESMCSRVFIRSKGESGDPRRTWLDSIASIKDATANDALFVMKDGTERRLAFMTDFRVLYVSNSNGRTEKLDLTKIQSLEFLDSGK
ncbi:MAG: hypothetical protein LAO55_17965 [Acidobacteriia bacterium]|nr:hypothetical protein [Terriglobia bacterium]